MCEKRTSRLFCKNYLTKAISEANCPQRHHYVLSVRLKANQTLIGTCSITEVKPKAVATNVGWHFGSSYWGNGYATEAARALLFIGFAMGDVAEIFADCFADNRASIRIMEKIGMKTNRRLGLFDQIRGWSYGENKPVVRYLISKQQWLNQTNRYRREGK
jgi:RimJ/RimL family protein N-acetyltransferase